SQALSLRNRGSARRLLSWFSMRGNAVRAFQRQPIFGEAERSPSPGSRRRRRLFALDVAPLRAHLCISLRDDLRPLSARLLDLVPRGAASNRRRVLCNRASRRSCGTLPPSLRLSRRGLFARRGAPLARHLPGHKSPAFVVEPARAVVGWHSGRV